LISLPRAAVRHYWTAYRQLLTGVPRRTWPVVRLLADPAGVRLAAHTGQLGLEFYLPGSQTSATLTVPYELIQSVAEGRGESVTVEPNGADGVLARWRDGHVPRQAAFTLPQPVVAVAAELPRQWTDQPANFLTELQTLMQVTDPESLRYAINCVQLDGDAGTLTATDGRQILSYSGGHLGFAGVVLVPANKVFGHHELTAAGAIRSGQTNSHFVVQAGPWTVWIAMQREGRFPRVHDLLAAGASAPTRLVLDPEDRRFLQENLPRLPERSDQNGAVTIELNGRVAIRAQDADASPPTELVLNRSSRIGDEVRFCTDRKFLAKALKFGFGELAINSPHQPASCRDERRTYLWALLEPEAALAASDDAIVIESQPGFSPQPVKPTSGEKLAKLPAPAASPASSLPSVSEPHAPVDNPRFARIPDVAVSADSSPQELTPIEQATALRNLARTVLAQANDFVRTVRRQHRELRELQRELRRRRRRPLQPTA
jgi:hypothetical protein